MRGSFGAGVLLGKTWTTRNAATFVPAGHAKSLS